MTSPSPGWYPDPQNPQLVRYWDGAGWTEHTQAGAAEQAVPAEPVTPQPPIVTPPTATPPTAAAPTQPIGYSPGGYSPGTTGGNAYGYDPSAYGPGTTPSTSTPGGYAPGGYAAGQTTPGGYTPAAQPAWATSPAGGAPGGGKSRVGLIIGIVAGALVVIAGAIFAMTQLGGSDDDADPTPSTSDAAPTETSTEPTDPATEITTPDVEVTTPEETTAPPATDTPASTWVALADLQIGQCFNDPLDDSNVFELEVVDCAVPHDNEVYADQESVSADFPGDEAMRVEAEDLCLAEFEAFIGLDYYDSAEIDVYYFYPTARSWAAGDRTMTCAVYDLNQQTVGSLAGAAR